MAFVRDIIGRDKRADRSRRGGGVERLGLKRREERRERKKCVAGLGCVRYYGLL